MPVDTFAFQASQFKQPGPVLAYLSGVHGTDMLFVQFRVHHVSNCNATVLQYMF